MDQQDRNHRELMAAHIGATITRWKREGTTGASFDCLKQCVSTAGVRCSPYVFHSTFNEIAAEVAKRHKFNVYESTYASR